MVIKWTEKYKNNDGGEKRPCKKIIIDHKTGIINYSYFILLKICKLDSQSKKLGRKRWVVHVHDNQMKRGYTWDSKILRTRRALKDIGLKPVIQRQVLIAGDINAHSSIWNPHCLQKHNTSVLEEIIDDYSFLITNEPGRYIRLSSQSSWVIDLVLSTTIYDPLTF